MNPDGMSNRFINGRQKSSRKANSPFEACDGHVRPEGARFGLQVNRHTRLRYDFMDSVHPVNAGSLRLHRLGDKHRRTSRAWQNREAAEREVRGTWHLRLRERRAELRHLVMGDVAKKEEGEVDIAIRNDTNAVSAQRLQATSNRPEFALSVGGNGSSQEGPDGLLL
jgi:hypothetical protein